VDDTTGGDGDGFRTNAGRAYRAIRHKLSPEERRRRNVLEHRGKRRAERGGGEGGKTFGPDIEHVTFQETKKPSAVKRAQRGVVIAGEALAPLLMRLSVWFARFRAPRGPDGRKHPLYLTTTETPTLLWQLTDEEAIRLGAAIGAFGKYLPLNEQQSALGIDIGLLTEALVSIAQERFVLEAIFLAQQKEQAAAAQATQNGREHPIDIPRHMDARARLYT
jgi:hypothetical protein